MAKQPLTTLFPVTNTTPLGPQFLNRLIGEIEARVSELQLLKRGLEAAISHAQEIAIDRLNEIIGPAQASLTDRLALVDAALSASQTLLADLQSGGVDLDRVTGLQEALDGKSETGHDHAIANITGLQNALNALAPKSNPAFSGAPTAPTAAKGTNSTQIATTAYVVAAFNDLLNGAPAALDTLNELAAAIADDANFAATLTAQLGNKADAKQSRLFSLWIGG